MELGLLSLGDWLPDPVAGTRVSQQQRLRSIVDLGVEGEELGFDMVAVGEHHFNDYIVSSPLMILAAIASRTSRIRLATAVTLMPLHDPVRLAEDFNTLDQLSGGRAELVLGRGISSDGYAEFGVEPAAAREVTVQKLQLLRGLWSEREVTWNGAHRPALSAVEIQPHVLQPDPRVWMGTGMSEDSVRWTAELGMPLMLPSIFKPAEEWRDLVALYRQLMAESGKGAKAFVGACSHVHIAPTSQEARDSWRPYLTGYAEWANRMRKSDVRVDFDRIVAGPAVCGSPAEVAERLLSLKEALQPDIHLSVFDIGGLPAPRVSANLELFASEVIWKIR
ncbi:LLM class flavin-dependent oxidoreductase [Nocardioides sp. Bht2]|uniref:LLM class flavin-dependent oxidoreductase n=1 Tax=Nocardioides sp. Bht2 TaxID=3392297 RepID=UPI0039B5E0BF